MSNSSLPSTWRANFRPYLDGIRKRWDDLVLNLVSGKRYQLKLEFDESYLIGDPESPIAIHFVPSGDVSGIEAVPPEGQLIEMVRDPDTFSSLIWILSTEHAHPGPFHIFFRMPLYDGMPDSPIISGQIENVTIDSLTCDQAVTYAGYEINAQALVLASPGGRPESGVTLGWTYAGKPLPDSTTDENGIASVTFAVPDVGEHDLTATLVSGLPDTKTLRIVVQELRRAGIERMTQYPFELPVGQSAEIAAFVRDWYTLQPLAGRKVHWIFNGYEFDVSYTDLTGRATARWLATGAVTGVVYVWAHVRSLDHIAEKSVPLNVVRSKIHK
ncbi:Ig-like domain-containing protein [Pseudomonas sp. UV AK001]|uniref:Ig-like domain-containing protein n=1 Tax=Pseudomonas sp. UV AK001 TaxID=3384791 RepID=UPI0038D3A944